MFGWFDKVQITDEFVKLIGNSRTLAITIESHRKRANGRRD